jgi:hypothetical protein
MDGTTELVDKIYAYEKADWFWRELQYDWTYRMSETGSADYTIKPLAADNQHDLYVTLADPLNAVVWETVLHISCTAARSETTVANTEDEVWTDGNFDGRDVRRKDGAQMGYYVDYTNGIAGKCWELIKQLDGECSTWASLYLECLRVHGIDNPNEYVHLVPSRPIERANGGFLVNNWEFIGNGTSGNTDYPYMNIIGAAGTVFPTATGYPFKGTPEVVDKNGIPGQKNANPASMFGNHQMTLIQSEYRDPSYGAVFAGADDVERATAVDDGAITGYYIYEERKGNEADLDIDLNDNNNKTDMNVVYYVMLIRRNLTGQNDLIRNPLYVNYPNPYGP